MQTKRRAIESDKSRWEDEWKIIERELAQLRRYDDAEEDVR